MQLVIADTGPLNYLILIDAVGILPKLFEKVFIPAAVRNELMDNDAPVIVRKWIAQSPSWLEIRSNPDNESDLAFSIDKGERAAIALASSLKVDLILMDDRAGVAVAYKKGFKVTGTLGVLDMAANRGFIKFDDAIDRLKKTTFRYRPDIIDVLLARHSEKTGKR